MKKTVKKSNKYVDNGKKLCYIIDAIQNKLKGGEKIKNKWTILNDMLDDDNQPTCWAIKTNHPYYNCVFVTMGEDGLFSIDTYVDGYPKYLKTCKSLAAAKKWVTTNIINKN